MSRLLTLDELRSEEFDASLDTMCRYPRIIVPRGLLSPIDVKYAQLVDYDGVRLFDPEAYTTDQWHWLMRLAARNWLETECRLPIRTKSMLWQLAGLSGGFRQSFTEKEQSATAGTTAVQVVGYATTWILKMWAPGGGSGAGAGGSYIEAGRGGCGAYLTARLNVVPLEFYNFIVGGNGLRGGSARRGGSGGGYSALQRQSDSVRRSIAGAGGGGGGCGSTASDGGRNGGHGGAQNGTPSGPAEVLTGIGGTTSTGGAGALGSPGETPGQSGSSLNGGDGGNASNGTFGGGPNGGTPGGGDGGAAATGHSPGGGGGGAGKFGGGGGGGRDQDYSRQIGGGAGGGGSSETQGTAVQYMQGSGTTAPNSSDDDYNGTAGKPGAATNSTVGNNGNDGLIVVKY